MKKRLIKLAFVVFHTIIYPMVAKKVKETETEIDDIVLENVSALLIELEKLLDDEV